MGGRRVVVGASAARAFAAAAIGALVCRAVPAVLAGRANLVWGEPHLVRPSRTPSGGSIYLRLRSGKQSVVAFASTKPECVVTIVVRHRGRTHAGQCACRVNAVRVTVAPYVPWKCPEFR